VNRLYFGDTLEWLRDTREFPDASVDLVYLDPATQLGTRITMFNAMAESDNGVSKLRNG